MYFQFLFVFPRKIKHVNEGDVSYIFHLLSKPKKKKRYYFAVLYYKF